MIFYIFANGNLIAKHLMKKYISLFFAVGIDTLVIKQSDTR
ncbi:hypothetical protein HMPREF3034_01825 [Prevotella sp. DNF00663]|nr:hypothetical protein HMPREF3034_01825 [Prevotella sp. DNF00663]